MGLSRDLRFGSIVVVVAMTLSGTILAQTPRSAEVESLFRQAQTAYREGRVEEAYAAYLDAWHRQRSFDIAGNLANVEMKLGKLTDAAAHFAYALRDFPPTGKPEAREALQQRLDEVRRQLGAIRVRAPAGATITIDGEPVGTAPLNDSQYVAPGSHTVGATLTGYQPTRRTVDPQRGETVDITLDLAPVGSSTASPATGAAVQPEPAPEAQRSAQRSLVPAIVGGAVAVVGLGAGILFTHAANSKDSDRADQLASLPGSNPCSPGSPNAAQCGNIQALSDDAHHDRSMALVGFVTAGVGAAATAAYLLWPRAAATQAASFRAVPMLGRRDAGVAFALPF
jgi:tetratricopeptide (TPR) repeat protein